MRVINLIITSSWDLRHHLSVITYSLCTASIDAASRPRTMSSVPSPSSVTRDTIRQMKRHLYQVLRELDAKVKLLNDPDMLVSVNHDSVVIPIVTPAEWYCKAVPPGSSALPYWACRFY
ncbi:hypothetical protein J6590_073407 [Homalodisca vitripennis]|nr:hypothetical protein J6590_073407 [Homalodisca vitripennis]